MGSCRWPSWRTPSKVSTAAANAGSLGETATITVGRPASSTIRSAEAATSSWSCGAESTTRTDLSATADVGLPSEAHLTITSAKGSSFSEGTTRPKASESLLSKPTRILLVLVLVLHLRLRLLRLLLLLLLLVLRLLLLLRMRLLLPLPV